MIRHECLRAHCEDVNLQNISAGNCCGGFLVSGCQQGGANSSPVIHRCETMPARSASEAASRDPETLAPLSARGNTLQFLIDSRVRQVKCVCDRGHGLETNEAFAWWSVHHHDSIFRSIGHGHLL